MKKDTFRLSNGDTVKGVGFEFEGFNLFLYKIGRGHLPYVIGHLESGRVVRRDLSDDNIDTAKKEIAELITRVGHGRFSVVLNSAPALKDMELPEPCVKEPVKPKIKKSTFKIIYCDREIKTVKGIGFTYDYYEFFIYKPTGRSHAPGRAYQIMHVASGLTLCSGLSDDNTDTAKKAVADIIERAGYDQFRRVLDNAPTLKSIEQQITDK